MGHHLDRQPVGVGGEAAQGQMVQPDAVLEVAYCILNLGVAAVISLQFQGNCALAESGQSAVCHSLESGNPATLSS